MSRRPSSTAAEVESGLRKRKVEEGRAVPFFFPNLAARRLEHRRCDVREPGGGLGKKDIMRRLARKKKPPWVFLVLTFRLSFFRIHGP